MQSAIGNNMVNVVASLDHAQGRKEKNGKGIGDKLNASLDFFHGKKRKWKGSKDVACLW
jgi:hypothetical protein